MEILDFMGSVLMGIAVFIWLICNAFKQLTKQQDMNEIDLNDTVTVELSEWGATYLNAMNTFTGCKLYY